MSWFIRNLGIFVATLAVSLSFATVVFGRRQRRQDMFLRVHEMLIDVEMQRGRRLVYQSGRQGHLPPEDSDDFALISRTLSVHNTVAVYVRRRIVSQQWVLAGWQNTLCDLRKGTTLFVEYRQETYGWLVCPDLDSLISSAERRALRRGDRGDARHASAIPRYMRVVDPAGGGKTLDGPVESGEAND